MVLHLRGGAPKKKAKLDVSSSHRPTVSDDPKDGDYRSVQREGHRKRSKRAKSPLPPSADEEETECDDVEEQQGDDRDDDAGDGNEEEGEVVYLIDLGSLPAKRYPWVSRHFHNAINTKQYT